MRVKDRSTLAYVVLKDAVGPYAPGESFQATELDVDVARRLLDEGVIAEVGADEDPEEVAETATAESEPETETESEAKEEDPAEKPAKAKRKP